MRKGIPLLAAAGFLCLAAGGGAAQTETGPPPAPAPAAESPFPLQVEMRVPFDPTAFPAAGDNHAVYELLLANLSAEPVRVQDIDVLDDQGKPGGILQSLAGTKLAAVLQPLGRQAPDATVIEPGTTTVVYLWLSLGRDLNFPARLRHRLRTDHGSFEGAVIDTRHTDLQTLAPPVRGGSWLVSDGPSNDADNHHRRGMLSIDGHLSTSRRYAIDWMIQKKNDISSGNPQSLKSYYAYGQPVFAVADATVVEAADGIPNNTPGSPETVRRAVPMSMQTIGGNHVVLDLGSGQYAWYFHLDTGSVRVKAGDRVRRGQALAQIGCSGDPTIPHLHFEVTTSPRLLAGEGVPYLIDRFDAVAADGTRQSRTGELPLGGTLVDFDGASTRQSKPMHVVVH